MSHNRSRLIMLGSLAALGLIFIVVTFIGLSLLATKSQRLVELKQDNKVADAQLSSLAASKKQVEQYSYFNDIAKTVLPSDKDQAQAVIDIFSLADQAGISIASITFPASSLGAAKPSTSESSSDATQASAKSAISQAKPVEGISGLYGLELTISPASGTSVPENKKVTYLKFLDFLSRIENNRRTAQITKVSIQPESSETGISQFINFTLTINIFIKP